MKHYAGIDVSLNSSSVCVVDESGKVVREVKVPSEPVALIHCIKSLGVRVERIGLEAGPLSQWLYGALRESGLPVELLALSRSRLRPSPNGSIQRVKIWNGITAAARPCASCAWSRAALMLPRVIG
jgi:hypothetical protein